MKTLFIILVSIMVIGMINSIALSIKNNNRFSEPIVNIVLTATAAMFFYTIHLVIYDETQGLLLRGLFFAGLDWIIFFMIRYIYLYTDMNIRCRRIRLTTAVLAVLSTIDTVSLIFNAFFRYAFTIAPVYDGQGAFYCWKAFYKVPFYIHITFCYLMIAYASILLIYKACKVLPLYRRKYLVILLVFALTCFLNALRLVFGWVLDISIFFYATMAMAICYLTFLVFPREIEASIHYMVTEQINGGVVCFDLNGVCMYISRLTRNIFPDTEEGRRNAQLYREKWTTPDTDYQAWEDHIVIGGTDHTFSVEYNRLKDKRGKLEGAYLIFQDRTKEVEKLEQERYKATHDMLTGLYNRVTFFEKAEEIIHSKPNVERYLIATNIKDFKLVNDLFGTDFGDKIIKEQARMLNFAQYEDCIKGRISADKFAMLINKENFSPKMAQNNTLRVQDAASEVNYKMHMYVGVYEIRNAWENVQTMYDKAHMAIDSIMDDYETNLAFYDTEMMEQAFTEKYIVGEFPKAIEQERFEAHLVPQYARDGSVYSMFMHLDWNHSVLGKLSMQQYMPILEKTGYSYLFDYYLWQQAMKQLSRWKLAGKETHVAVSISPKSFYYENVYEKLKYLVMEYDVDPHKLVVEITETAFRRDSKMIVEALNALHSFGFEIVIDNFGSGFSSLNLLKDVQVDILKLDSEFIKESENEERSRTILSMIITMANNLGIKVVANGVVSQEQIKFLVDMGCIGYQGAYCPEKNS